jgi:L-2-hydroxyglutarate oxidase
MMAFCQAEAVPFEICGKVVVATDTSQLASLQRIEERALSNGVRVERVGPERLRELEPEAYGTAALWVPDTGIVDFRVVCERLAARVVQLGGQLLLGTELLSSTTYPRSLVAETTRGPISAKIAIAAAGLQADRVSQRMGQSPTNRIVPFRGEYYLLTQAARSKVRGLIYPVPDPRYPFLGVHFTRRITGAVDCGPNAVLALGRETYARGQVDWEDLLETLGFGGFQRLAWHNLRYGLEEARRSWSKAAFVEALRKLLPSITSDDLEVAPAGIRAQAVTPQGDIVHDFLIEEGPRLLSVFNAPSPAATASLEIGAILAEQVNQKLEALAR